MTDSLLQLKPYSTDKFQNGLLERYKKLLAPQRYNPIHLLEIGIYKGGSIQYWDDYLFHQDARITAIDLTVPKDLTCSGRVSLLEADQNDTATLESIAASHGPFDFVIDDGAHMSAETQSCFSAFFPGLKSGGYYAIEDWAVGYLQEGYEKYHGMVDVIADILRDAENLGISDMEIVREDTCALAIFRKR